MVSLDDSQLKFIQAPEENIRLLAPAGCGKTLCLLYRCKHLAETSPTSQRFLIVTFTRAARDELRSRVAEVSEFADVRDQIEITTLNSWGYRRLRNVKKNPSPKTINVKDFHSTLTRDLSSVWKNHERISEAIQNGIYQAPKILMNMIDAFKSLGFVHSRRQSKTDFKHHWKELESQGLAWRLDEQVNQLVQLNVLDEDVTHMEADARISEVYETWYGFWCAALEHLWDIATFTFEGQKYFAYLGERQSYEEGRFLSGAASYDHVFVDEFQDINPLDLALVRAIVERSRASLTILGDDDQAIFEWRGATPEYILSPDRFFGKSFKTYPLGWNYRSPANIVKHSQLLISNNRRRVEKQVSAKSSKKAKIEVIEISSLSKALEYVDSLLSGAIAQGENPNQVALIGRLRNQIIPYQIHFALREVQFCADEDLQIFLSKTFGNLLSLLDIKARADGKQRTRRIVDDILLLCRYVKRSSRLSRPDERNLRKFLLGARPDSIMMGANELSDYRKELKRVKNEDGRISIEMADAIRAFIDSESVSESLVALSENFVGLQKDFDKAEEDIFYTDPPFLQLAEYAKRYGSDFDSFIEDLESAKDIIESANSVEDYCNDTLHLMTALRAKGKEFDSVVLLDVQDGIWPHKNERSSKQLEGARRVFYVAFTRAREQVTMLIHKSSVPSPYIDELRL